MPFRVTCTTCGTRFALNDDLYERKIKNRIVTIRCRSCSADISVDGAALEAGTAGEPTTSPSDRPLDSDAVPSAAPPADFTPTLPLQGTAAAADGQTPTPALDSRAKTAGLWVVCCPDQDDRELTLPEIEAAIAKNEINGDAIVWRDGMAEWLPIHQVPELRVLLKKPPLPKPKQRTLLGIGVKPAVPAAGAPPPGKPGAPPASNPDSEPLSVEPEPLSASSEILLQQRRGSAVALSPGLLSVKEGPKAEPPPRKRLESIPDAPPRPKLDSKPEPPPRKRMESVPDALPRPKLDSKPDAPARPRMDSRPDRVPKPPTPVRVVTRLLIEERGPDSAPDSSGTPNLRALASVGPKKPRDEGDKRTDDFLWQVSPEGAGNELLGAPTIDVSGLSGTAQPAAEPEPAPSPSEAPPSSTAKKKKKKKTSSRPPAAKPAVQSAAAEQPPESKPEAERKGGMLWAVLVVAAVLGGGFLLLRGKGTPAPPPEPAPPAPVVEQQAAPPTVPEPAATAAPAPIEPAPSEPAAPPTAATEKPAPAKSEESRAERKAAAEREPSAREPAPTEPKAAPTAAPTGTATAKPEKTAAASTAATAEPPAEGAPAAPFDRAAANSALNAAAAQASSCRKEGDPTGAASVVVTFAPSGRVTSANVNGPPFAGTATGGCIAAAMRRARVPPFSGDRVTVGKTVAIR